MTQLKESVEDKTISNNCIAQMHFQDKCFIFQEDKFEITSK